MSLRMNNNQKIIINRIKKTIDSLLAIHKGKFELDINQGFLQAFLWTFESALNQSPLNKSHWLIWMKYLYNQKNKTFVKSLTLDEWLIYCEKANKQLAILPASDIAIAKTISNLMVAAWETLDSCNEKESIPIFFLIITFLFTWYRIPWLTIKEDEEIEFKNALVDSNLMEIFLIKKMQEAIFSPEGEILEANVIYGTTISYISEKGHVYLTDWRSLSVN